MRKRIMISVFVSVLIVPIMLFGIGQCYDCIFNGEKFICQTSDIGYSHCETIGDRCILSGPGCIIIRQAELKQLIIGVDGSIADQKSMGHEGKDVTRKRE